MGMRILETEEERIKDFKNFAGDIFSERQIQNLKDMGYFTMPASTKFHGKEKGDGYLHSKFVAMLLKEYTDAIGLNWKNKIAPVRIGLLHDICKADDYRENENGNFEPNRNKIMPGHGDKSAIMALQIEPGLTDEEVMCIRYHMGAFEGQNAWESFTNAVNRYPNILWTHQADMVASQVLKI